MVAAVAFEIEHGVDHVLDDTRPRDLAFLGDVANQNNRCAGGFGIADHRLRRRADLCDRAGRRFGNVGPQRLDRINDDEIGPLAAFQCRQNVLDIGLRREFDRRGSCAEALGAEPDLRDGLFTRNINDAMACRRQGGGCLHQEGRFADARIPADEQRRPAHKAAAGDAVEFGDAGADAWRILDFAGQCGERHNASLARRAHPRRPAADAGRQIFFDNGVPFAARVAFARPPVMHRAACLADEGGFRGFGHQAIASL